MIHVIVATAEWGKDQLRYRRHRLAEFLVKPGRNKGSHLGLSGSAHPKDRISASTIRHPSIRRKGLAAKENVSLRTIYRCVL